MDDRVLGSVVELVKVPSLASVVGVSGRLDLGKKKSERCLVWCGGPGRLCWSIGSEIAQV